MRLYVGFPNIIRDDLQYGIGMYCVNGLLLMLIVISICIDGFIYIQTTGISCNLLIHHKSLRL